MAEPCTATVTWPDVPSATEYKIYAGSVGETPTEYIGTSPLVIPIELINSTGEFYGVACNSVGCGPESQHVIAQKVQALPGIFQIQVQMGCNN